MRSLTMKSLLSARRRHQAGHFSDLNVLEAEARDIMTRIYTLQ